MTVSVIDDLQLFINTLSTSFKQIQNECENDVTITLKHRGKLFLHKMVSTFSLLTNKFRAAKCGSFCKTVQRKGKVVFSILIVFIVILSVVSIYKKQYEGKRFLTTTRLSIMDKEVQRACRYIEDNFENPELNRTMISSELITGESFLEAMFEKELGLSIEAFVNQVRINRIKIYLRKDPSIDEETLTRYAGYLHADQMKALFKEVTGESVSTYRNVLLESIRT